MGCVVDVIRYPYRTTMRFYKDSDIETPVCWYFCSPGAKPLGCYTRFGSGLYGKDHMDRWEGVGEAAFGPLDFRANCCQFPGAVRLGTAQQFAEGIKLADRPAVPPQLAPACDGVPTIDMTFGAVFMDLRPEVPVHDVLTFQWSVYQDSHVGYIAWSALLTMTCELDPSLNGSWVVSWTYFPDNIFIYTFNWNGFAPNGVADPSLPTFAVARRDEVGSVLDVDFVGTGLRLASGLSIIGTPRPVSYSASSIDGHYGNVSITLTEHTPFVPLPHVPPLR